MSQEWLKRLATNSSSLLRYYKQQVLIVPDGRGCFVHLVKVKHLSLSDGSAGGTAKHSTLDRFRFRDMLLVSPAREGPEKCSQDSIRVEATHGRSWGAHVSKLSSETYVRDIAHTGLLLPLREYNGKPLTPN